MKNTIKNIAICTAIGSLVAACGGGSEDASTSAASGSKLLASPGSNFDLSKWSLQLPTGSVGHVDTVSSSQLEGGYTKKPYFYSDSDGSMVMMDPTKGFGTGGTKHPRTELHENKTWSPSGTNELDATLKVTKVPSNTTVAQIFQGSGNSKPLCELQVHSSGAVELFLETKVEGGSGSVQHPITSVSIGSKFTYHLALKGKAITVKVNGTTKTIPLPSAFNSVNSYYFKAGDYDQSAHAIQAGESGSPGTSDGTVVKFYALKITH